MSTLVTNTITGLTTATSVTLPTTTKVGTTAIVSASAGSATIIGEGGTVVTNIQQGLCKYWVIFTQASNAVGDSFNHASATDNGTGDHTLTITSDFSSAEHAANAQHMQESGDNEGGFAATKARAAGTLRIQGIENDRSALHDVIFQAHSWGDLA